MYQYDTPYALYFLLGESTYTYGLMGKSAYTSDVLEQPFPYSIKVLALE